MRYADIKPFDLNNGDGVRVSLWVTGCPIHCPNCHNEHIWDKEKGNLFTSDTLDYIVELLADPSLNKQLSILGGEPLAVWNYEEVLNVCKYVKSVFPNKDIWLWTGYNYDQIKELDIFKYLDVVIDGQYIDNLKDHDTWWRGSTNQRMIKLKNGVRLS